MATSENIRRAVCFESPDAIPMHFHINAACWHVYPHDALWEMMERHPFLFPGFTRDTWRPPVYLKNARAGVPYTDEWGCVWETTENGIVGAVTHHPLADLHDLATYRAPLAEETVDWTAEAERIARANKAGELSRAALVHGHTFLRACDLHGYTNVLLDLTDEDEKMVALLDMIEEYNTAIVKKYLALGVQLMEFPEDLGMQVGPMISPALFRTYILPSYRRLMGLARDKGCMIHMHSDGDIRQLANDLITDGVDALNLQDLVNGLDWIKEYLAGRVCIDLDIDRQTITRFGTPSDIDELIRQEVTLLGSREGGLMMIYGLYPGVPLANIRALMDALERYAGYYA